MQRLLNTVSAVLMLIVVLYAFGIFGYAIYSGMKKEEPVAEAVEEAAPAATAEAPAAEPAAEETAVAEPAAAPAAEAPAAEAPAAEEVAAEEVAAAPQAAPAPVAKPDPAVEAAVAKLVASRPPMSTAGLPEALQPATFDADAVLAMIADSDLSDTVKASLSGTVENARTNPGMVLSAALQVKEALGLKAKEPKLVKDAPSIDMSGLPAALQPESFDADAVLQMIAESGLSDTVKSSLSTSVEAARTNPGMVQGVALQVKEALGL
jgi:colicin import membrane protein